MLQLKRIFICLMISALCLSGTLAPVTISFAQQPDYAQEANNSAAMLDIVNAQTAYDQNFTGNNIVIGVIDSPVRIDHIDLMGITTMEPIVLNNGTTVNPSDIDWGYPNNHGTHVSGIIAAHRNGIGMHGVAYNAELATTAQLISLGTDPSSEPLYPVDVSDNFFTQNPEVRIVNNSWGGRFFPYLPKKIIDMGGNEVVGSWAYQGNTANDVWDLYGGINYFFTTKEREDAQNFATSYTLAKVALDAPDKLFVWAAGNEGVHAPTEESLMPRYMGSGLNNWLSVGALDSSVITRQADGNLSVAPGGFATYSNQAIGAELWTVFAPGTLIYSANATDLKGFVKLSGTSMAAPVVCGAAGLVQQNFPWMTGKHLADTILSTANSDFTAPQYIIQEQQAINSSPKQPLASWDSLVFTFIVDVTPSAAPTLTQDEAKELLKEHYEAHPEAWGSHTLETLYANFIDRKAYAVSTATKEEVFGQGILDVGKAMGGVAELNANRMTADNVYNIATLQSPIDAYETFDTQGYNAEFSNDISQAVWDDKYHHPEYQYQNNTDTGYNSAALQLFGKNVGLEKAGLGRLILSGNNTYAGATLVTGGELTIAKRSDGSGGTLENSDVYVGEKTRLSGNGTIAQSLINYGTVAPGIDVATLSNASFLATASMTTNAAALPLVTLEPLTVGTYTQKSSGNLGIYFDVQGRSSQISLLNNNSNIEGGSLTFLPTAGFYRGTQSVTVFTGQGATPTGNFTTWQYDEISPVLGFNILQTNNSDYVLTTLRSPNAYSQYAQSTTARNLGKTLIPLANEATGDLQTLLVSLDFSAADGHEIKTALTQLSAETYDLLSHASLTQQSAFNRMLWKRAQIKRRGVDESEGLLAQDIGDKSKHSVELWAQALASWGSQDATSAVSGYSTESAGVITGFDWGSDFGLTMGLNFAFIKRKLTDFDYHNAKVDTEGFSLGLTAQYAPVRWDGFYVMAQGRLGLEQNTMNRAVAVGNSYNRYNQSDWTDFVGSALLGGGHDWYSGQITFGPLVWLEYTFLHRPGVSETGGMGTSLRLKDAYHSSLRSTLGVQMRYSGQLSDTLNVDLSALAVWQHELLNNNLRTTSSFAGYDKYSFTSKTPLFGQNIFALEAQMRLTHKNNIFFEFNAGGELTDDNGKNLYLGVNFGYSF